MAGDDCPDDSEIGFIIKGSLVASVCFVGCVAGVVFVHVAGFVTGFVALFFFSTFSPSTGSSHFIFTTGQAKHDTPSFWMKQLCFKLSQRLQLFSLTTPVDWLLSHFPVLFSLNFLRLAFALCPRLHFDVRRLVWVTVISIFVFVGHYEIIEVFCSRIPDCLRRLG